MTHAMLSAEDRGQLREAVEVLQGRLYFRSVFSPPRDTPTIHFFSTDKLFVYEPFFLDFGPLNLSCIYRYCMLLKAKLASDLLQRKVLVHYTTYSQQKVTNAVLLLGSFLVAAMGKTPEEAMKPFARLNSHLKPYRDATYSACDFRLPVLDCLRGLAYAMQLGWFSLSSFNQAAYDHYEKLENGDMSWVIPGKFLAFSCPSVGAATMSARRSEKEDSNRSCSSSSSNSSSNSSSSSSSSSCCDPSYYVHVFKELNIKLVIRLNKKMYDEKIFKDAGIDHQDLFFLDGTCPPRGVMEKFVQLCEACDGAVAVHCKAGLGRTGSLIGCYAMKNHKFPALPWIGWNRICRPGSVLGPQQYFLCAIQDELMKLDAAPGCLPVVQQQHSSCTAARDSGVDSLTLLLEDMGLEDKQIAEHGDEGQGDRLMLAKRRSKATSGEDPSGLLSSSCSSLSSKSKSMNLEDRSASLRFEAAEGPAPLDVLLRGSVTPIIPSLAAGGAAAAAAAWKASNNSCHAAPAAAAAAAGAAASGVRLTSPSRPLGSRSRNDV